MFDYIPYASIGIYLLPNFVVLGFVYYFLSLLTSSNASLSSSVKITEIFKININYNSLHAFPNQILYNFVPGVHDLPLL